MSGDAAQASRRGACPVCGRTGLNVFFRAEGMPVLSNVLYATRAEAVGAERGPIHLGWCDDCGMIANVAFEPGRIVYEGAYENSLHFSPHFQQYADRLARRLVDRYALRGKDVLEIGCGAGDFLAALCEAGENRGHGFDPGHNPRHAAQPRAGTLAIVAEEYGPGHADCPADFVVSRHVLEHVPRPVEFLRGLRETAPAARRPGFYIEVPNALWTIRDLGVWDVIYEHCSYFTPPALVEAAQRAGLAVEAVAEAYDGQFLAIEGRLHGARGAGRDSRTSEGARKDSRTSPGGWVRPAVSEIGPLVERFASHRAEKVRYWEAQLAKLGGKRIALWGAGSKGITFLNAVRGAREAVQAVIDLNPRKWGKFVAGAGTAITGPDGIRELGPEWIVVMNASYVPEIRAKLSELGWSGPLLTA